MHIIKMNKIICLFGKDHFFFLSFIFIEMQMGKRVEERKTTDIVEIINMVGSHSCLYFFAVEI